MTLGGAVRMISEESRRLGYRSEAIHRNYAYSDVWQASGNERAVPLAVFTQTPPSYRSAAFGVVEGSAQDAPGLVARHRSLGAPLLFVVEGDTVSSWQVRASEAPRLLERLPLEDLPARFSAKSQVWAPDPIHRAKSIGRVDPRYQLDFVDIGLVPAIEGEIHLKLDRLIREAMVGVDGRQGGSGIRLLFRGVFRLLAAKILTDRRSERASSWNADEVGDVITRMGAFYSLGAEETAWPGNSLAALDPIWRRFREGFNVANISADDLAYIYESTLVTPQARAEFSTHSTPRHVADYIVDRLRLWEFGEHPPKVYEPFAGAGVLLGSALRQMRDGLPTNWSDERRHELLVGRIGGAEIDPFACEVAKLSLILADYPNANGWRIEETDLFAEGALASRLEGRDVILCNPPFATFTDVERRKYPDAASVDGSKAVFALETALKANPTMLGFVVPSTLLVDRRYRDARREVERAFREIELVSLPDRVFNVSRLDTALLVARDRRDRNETQTIVSSAVFDADTRRFAFDRKPSRRTVLERAGPDGDGVLWSPPLQPIWTALAEHPKVRSALRGHWGLRWKGGQKKVRRVFDEPGTGLKPGYMHGGALHQFSLDAPAFLDARPEELLGGADWNWDEPKILTNAGRFSRAYWRLAAVVERTGAVASQQFIGLWPTDGVPIDLDALAAVLNGPVVNAFLTEHSFDKRFRIAALENAPIPRTLPSRLGDLSRTYAALASSGRGDQRRLTELLAEIDDLVVDAYGLDAEQRRDLHAAFGTSERPIRGAVRRRSVRRQVGNGDGPLPLFRERDAETSHGEALGQPLDPIEAAERLEAAVVKTPLDAWAGPTVDEIGTRSLLNEGYSRFGRLRDARDLIGFEDELGIRRYPSAQFRDGEPTAGVADVVETIGDARVAWRWLVQPHGHLEGHSPLEILQEEGPARLASLISRDFH